MKQVVLLSQRGRAILPVCLYFNNTIPHVQSFIIIIVIMASGLKLRTIKLCSVVFGVTLKLVINTSSSVLPAMSVNNLPRFGAAVRITLGGRTVRPPSVIHTAGPSYH